MAETAVRWSEESDGGFHATHRDHLLTIDVAWDGGWDWTVQRIGTRDNTLLDAGWEHDQGDAMQAAELAADTRRRP